MANKKIRVLIIDDSAIVRQILKKGLEQDPQIIIAGVAANVFEGRDMIVYKKPDVVTLDIEMPRMDGLTFLRKLMPQFPVPVIILSSLTGPDTDLSLQAIESGAVDVVVKPSTQMGVSLQNLMVDLIPKIKAASRVDVSHWLKRRPVNATSGKIHYREGTADPLIAVGASTGGTVAIKELVNALPSDFPGMIIVQHMPPVFTKMFSDKLNETARMEVREAINGEPLKRGLVLIAPGGYQTEIVPSHNQYKTKIYKGEKVSGHCPSVDVLFASIAQSAGAKAIGIILTGMGSDGAEGMGMMRRKGAFNIAQDEDSSVVYGMPRAAYEKGGVDIILPLAKIPEFIITRLNEAL